MLLTYSHGEQEEVKAKEGEIVQQETKLVAALKLAFQRAQKGAEPGKFVVPWTGKLQKAAAEATEGLAKDGSE